MRIVIIGAGVAGLAIGLRLQQAGAEVWIVERSQPGSGATGASAGMIAVTAELLDSQPAEIELANHSNSLWPDFAAEIEAASGRKIGFSQSGALILADEASALARLERQMGGVMVDAARARDLAPLLTADVAGGRWVEKEAHLDPRALTRALAVAFQKAGGRLQINEAVVRIEQRGGRAAIAHTPFGLYHADAFLVAAGAWSSLLDEKAAPIAPVKGQMIALTPPPGVALPGPVIWGQGVYLVPRGSHLLVGATVETVGFDTQPTDVGLNVLWNAATRLMASVRDWTLADHWAGLRPRSPDGLPLLGPTAIEGLWVAGGQFRNGILYAPAIAETMRDQILGKAAPIAAFDPRRFK